MVVKMNFFEKNKHLKIENELLKKNIESLELKHVKLIGLVDKIRIALIDFYEQ